jgi:SH3-like domain-containing protein
MRLAEKSETQSGDARTVRITHGEHAGQVAVVVATEIAKWHRVRLADGSMAWVHRADVEHLEGVR